MAKNYKDIMKRYTELNETKNGLLKGMKNKLFNAPSNFEAVEKIKLKYKGSLDSLYAKKKEIEDQILKIKNKKKKEVQDYRSKEVESFKKTNSEYKEQEREVKELDAKIIENQPLYNALRETLSDPDMKKEIIVEFLQNNGFNISYDEKKTQIKANIGDMSCSFYKGDKIRDIIDKISSCSNNESQKEEIKKNLNDFIVNKAEERIK